MLESWTIQRIFAIEFDWGNNKTNFKNPIKTLANLRCDTGEYRPTVNLHYEKWYSVNWAGYYIRNERRFYIKKDSPV
jgi:hypothetical protein